MMLSECGLNSATDIWKYLLDNDVYVDRVISLESSANVIYLADKTSVNWKQRNKQIRINCKEPAKIVIEQKAHLKAIANGTGDSVREYSFLLDTLEELNDAIAALKTMDAYNAFHEVCKNITVE